MKASYIDGTQSDWSNTQMVTLADGGHDHRAGDVNHDGFITIADVSALIDLLLGSDNGACISCADVNGDSEVSIADVSVLIDLLLTAD